MLLRAAATLALAASTASAQVAAWYWTVSDTGNGDGIVEPGESVVLTLWINFDPRQDQYGGGFAQAGPYDILGNNAWAQGTVDERTQLLDFPLGNGTLDEASNILDLDHFQLPLWWQHFRNENPIDLFRIRWTPHEYTPRTVTLDNGGPEAFIYVDDAGNYLPYSGDGGFVAFTVVPAPAASTVLGLVALAAARRRR